MSAAIKPRFNPLEIPTRMRSRPLDHRGFPVPWFVHQKEDGSYDFRVIRRDGIGTAIRRKTCWLCGEPLGRFMCFTVGPMCVVNRISSEPPSHVDCARFAARSCPFLTQPKMRRNDHDLIGPGYINAPGFPAERNPGGAVLYVTRDFSMMRAYAGNSGHVIKMGLPVSVGWFTLGREATPAEASRMLEDGISFLMETARQHDGTQGVEMLTSMAATARLLLPG